MKITEIIGKGVPTLSFEVFPPKTSDKFESVAGAAFEIATLKPDYMSVTCGAGGKPPKKRVSMADEKASGEVQACNIPQAELADEFTSQIAATIKNNYGVPVLQHITCVNATRETVKHTLECVRANNIDNCLALRGDLPEGYDADAQHDFKHANELVKFIKENADVAVGCACYPEGHPESESLARDIESIKRKVDAGCDFLVTQMFFDNNVLYKYLFKLREAGVTVPVVAGIMPITNIAQVNRARMLSGCTVPSKFRNMVDRFGSDAESMRQAGIIYASEQIIDLLSNGINAIHIYTMNKPSVAKQIQKNLKGIID